MLRLLASALVRLVANAVGLVIAALVLDGVSITGLSFLIAVGVFSAIQVVTAPLLRDIALRRVPALMGSVALVTTFIGLVATSLLTSGLSISGVTSWVLATIIVWLVSLVAVLVLPLLIFRRVLKDEDHRR
ncbi:MAG: phage holin family protein [Actinomycetes bacterium]